MCCGSDDDYDHDQEPVFGSTNTEFYSPTNNSRTQQRQKQQRPSPPRYQSPTREQIEKRDRQARATAAAHQYGWPTLRGVAGNMDTNLHRTLGNRDSIIEPRLAGNLATMPGSDYRSVYDPNKRRQPQPQPSSRTVHQRPSRAPAPNTALRGTPPPTTTQKREQQQQSQPQSPPYYQQRGQSQQQKQQYSRPIYQQPQGIPPMTMTMGMAPATTMQDARRVPQRVNTNENPRGTVAARKPVIQSVHPVRPVLNNAHAHAHVHAPQAARLVRRDSNGVSECSDDDDDDDAHDDDDDEDECRRRGNLRDYTVSPVQSPQFFNHNNSNNGNSNSKKGPGLYSQLGIDLPNGGSRF